MLVGGTAVIVGVAVDTLTVAVQVGMLVGCNVAVEVGVVTGVGDGEVNVGVGVDGAPPVLLQIAKSCA